MSLIPLLFNAAKTNLLSNSTVADAKSFAVDAHGVGANTNNKIREKRSEYIYLPVAQ